MLKKSNLPPPPTQPTNQPACWLTNLHFLPSFLLHDLDSQIQSLDSHSLDPPPFPPFLIVRTPPPFTLIGDLTSKQYCLLHTQNLRFYLICLHQPLPPITTHSLYNLHILHDTMAAVSTHTPSVDFGWNNLTRPEPIPWLHDKRRHSSDPPGHSAHSA